MADKKMTLDEAMEMLEKSGVMPGPTPVPLPSTKGKQKVKDLLIEGSKQGRAGLGKSAKKQLELLEKENY